MHSAIHCDPSTQMPLEGIQAGASSVRAHRTKQGRGGARERITIDLRGIGRRLKAYAATHGSTPTAAVRLALVQMLDADADSTDDGQAADPAASTATRTTKVTLRVSAEYAALLTRRARMSEVSQGRYVCALLDGESPAPLSANHEACLKAMVASTDHLAVLSADLNGFLRAMGQIPNAELQRYRASVVSVVEDVRKHLLVAATLIAEIRTARRGRR